MYKHTHTNTQTHTQTNKHTHTHTHSYICICMLYNTRTCVCVCALCFGWVHFSLNSICIPVDSSISASSPTSYTPTPRPCINRSLTARV